MMKRRNEFIVNIDRQKLSYIQDKLNNKTTFDANNINAVMIENEILFQTDTAQKTLGTYTPKKLKLSKQSAKKNGLITIVILQNENPI